MIRAKYILMAIASTVVFLVVFGLMYLIFRDTKNAEDSSVARTLVGGYCDNRFGMVVADNFVTPYEERRPANSDKVLDFIASKFDFAMLAGMPRPWYIHNKGRNNYETAIIDQFVERMNEQRNMRLTYQMLLWDNIEKIGIKDDGVWDWYEKLPRNERLKALEEHVRTIVKKYKHSFRVFEVANHSVTDGLPIFTGNDNDYMMTGLSRKEIILKALQWAREEDKNAILLISDYRVEEFPYERQKFIDLIKYLKQKNAPLDAIGLQAHLGYAEPGALPSAEQLNSVLDEFAALGYRIHITEFDLSHDFAIPDLTQPFKGYPNWYEYQAYAYGEAMRIFTDHPAVDIINMRVLFEGQSSMRPDTGLFSSDLKPNAKFIAMEKYLMRQGCKYSARRTSPIESFADFHMKVDDCSDIDSSEFKKLSIAKQNECLGAK